jgi:hypothetical protein
VVRVVVAVMTLRDFPVELERLIRDWLVELVFLLQETFQQVEVEEPRLLVLTLL